MILDTQTKLSDAQALTATAISANVIDLRAATGGTAPATQDEGLTGANESWLVVQAITAAAGGDAAKTLTITLESAADAALSSGPVVHFSSGAILGAAITAGATLVRIALPSADYKRYLGLRYTVSAAFTAFNVTAFINVGVQRNVVYPNGFSVA